MTAAAELLEELYPGRWALALIAVKARGKVPVKTDWNGEAAERWCNGADRSAHLDHGAGWLAKGGNLGLALPPGVVALDADDEQAAAWLDLALPDAPMQQTAKGAHFIVRVPESAEIRATVGVEILEGVRIDVRVGGRSQIVAAPSTHETGHTYAWRRELPETVEELPECPPLILERITAPPALAPKPDATEASIPAGQRNDALSRIAGKLRRPGLSAEALEAALLIENARRCDPPLTETEVRAIARSIGSYPAGDAGEPEPKGTEQEAVVVSLADVKPERIRWLWEGRLALGKVGILDGDPGLGKSMMTTDLAARVSTGSPMPDGSPGQLGGVVLLSAEDDLADTIRPRLDAADADVSKVVAITGIRTDDGDRLPVIPGDLDRIEQTAKGIDAKLIVIDPLMAYLGGGVDTHRDQDVRRALAPLARLAQNTGAALLVVRHLNKAPAGNPLYRGGGSIGIIAAARTGLLLARDPDDEDRRVLATTKNNVGPEAAALSFEIDTTEAGVPLLHWLGGSDQTAASLLASPGAAEADTKLREAVGFLEQVLAGGRIKTTEIDRQARELRITKRTLDRAKAALRVRSIKGDFGGGWWWELPAKDANAASEGSNTTTVGTLGTLGGNRSENGGFKDAKGWHTSGQNPKDATVPSVGAVGKDGGSPGSVEAPSEAPEGSVCMVAQSPVEEEQPPSPVDEYEDAEASDPLEDPFGEEGF